MEVTAAPPQLDEAIAYLQAEIAALRAGEKEAILPALAVAVAAGEAPLPEPQFAPLLAVWTPAASSFSTELAALVDQFEAARRREEEAAHRREDKDVKIPVHSALQRVRGQRRRPRTRPRRRFEDPDEGDASQSASDGTPTPSPRADVAVPVVVPEVNKEEEKKEEKKEENVDTDVVMDETEARTEEKDVEMTDGQDEKGIEENAENENAEKKEAKEKNAEEKNTEEKKAEEKNAEVKVEIKEHTTEEKVENNEKVEEKVVEEKNPEKEEAEAALASLKALRKSMLLDVLSKIVSVAKSKDVNPAMFSRSEDENDADKNEEQVDLEKIQDRVAGGVVCEWAQFAEQVYLFCQHVVTDAEQREQPEARHDDAKDDSKDMERPSADERDNEAAETADNQDSSNKAISVSWTYKVVKDASKAYTSTSAASLSASDKDELAGGEALLLVDDDHEKENDEAEETGEDEQQEEQQTPKKKKAAPNVRPPSSITLSSILMATSKRRSVVLHFDLNRTVLMSDAAGGRTMENTVDYLLSECSWGYVNPNRPSEWICVSGASSIEPPAAETNGHKLITYKQFVDDAHPYQSLAAAQGRDIDQIKAVNKAAKKKRTALQSAFTGGEDAPGRRVRDSFKEVMEKLHFPMGEQREAAKQLAATMPKSRLQEAWSEGRYYLLPSFLQFLSYLSSPKVTEKEMDVKLVFRTFGDDIVEVARELDLLVDGQHPVGLPALPERFRLKLEPTARRIGTFYRDGFEADGTALAVGTLTKVPFSSKLVEEGPSAPNNFYATSDPEVKVIRGFQSIQETLNGMLQGASTLALRDYWEWWSAHAEDGQYGKLLLIDDEKMGKDDDVTVFFDDHIEAHHPHIVDVRDVRSGAPVDFEKSRGKYLQRVEPFAAITDPNYFTSLFEKFLSTAMNNQPSKRKRTDTSPVKTPAAPLPDAETELLRALEEEILKEEEKNKHDKNKKFPLEEEENDDYDESDDE
ncbi:hypothetical protein JG687_00009580 [Phytophthora cactorum]|uniref:Uncharacterized protein n=3 Tax=Phytophthora cactorum TaxID=29920 RepID=A0A8T1UBC2_9STRA|nr:hypothetical protein JG687_00009580 [Phytophthora cactorum]